MCVNTKNALSGMIYQDVVWEKIQKEVDVLRVAGPFESPPFEFYPQSPLGMVPKAGQLGKFRLIFDLSSPHDGRSVNANTPQKY